MTAERFSKGVLYRLLDELCDESLDSDQMAGLDQLLQTNREARRLYLEYLDLHATLQSAMPLRLAIPPSMLDELLGDTIVPGDSGTDSEEFPLKKEGNTNRPIVSAALPSVPVSLLDESSDGSGGILAGAIWSPRFITLLVTALLIGAAGIVGLSSLSRRAHLPDVETASHTTQIAHGRVNSVRLESGSTELTLDDIGTVIIEGPSDFELIGPMRARLTRGRIRVRVTEPTGYGFVVETPHGNVTDLGTEFALDVPEKGNATLVVFDGAVDLEVDGPNSANGLARPERLVRGEGVSFARGGQLSRIMSIVTGGVATFESDYEASDADASAIITHVTDNIRSSESRKFYEIVLRGLREDVLAYVDRPHEWNGIGERGLPVYLSGADYVKTFNVDKTRRDVEIRVTLTRPARFFVFMDDRVEPPQWLKAGFRDTGDNIGLDTCPWIVRGTKYMPGSRRGAGPGNSVDERFSIWERVISEPGVLVLGPNSGHDRSGMYAFAATALDKNLLEQN